MYQLADVHTADEAVQKVTDMLFHVRVLHYVKLAAGMDAAKKAKRKRAKAAKHVKKMVAAVQKADMFNRGVDMKTCGFTIAPLHFLNMDRVRSIIEKNAGAELKRQERLRTVHASRVLKPFNLWRSKRWCEFSDAIATENEEAGGDGGVRESGGAGNAGEGGEDGKENGGLQASRPTTPPYMMDDDTEEWHMTMKEFLDGCESEKKGGKNAGVQAKLQEDDNERPTLDPDQRLAPTAEMAALSVKGAQAKTQPEVKGDTDDDHERKNKV